MELFVCSDCAMWHANGDTELLDDETRAAVTGYDGHLAIDCGENAEHCVEFSWSSCDACRSPLGGSRHRAFIMN